ncbi:ATP-binding protein [Streptomyces bikiniensis]|uniref:ATP-binding protein n=1 Tax=Streptomyces bikiniensis TaxID=1896 RepID=A0ABW8D133_STRBI
MATDVIDGGHSSADGGGFGRRRVRDAFDTVVGEVTELLARRGGAVVHGPWGAGKSTLLEAVHQRWSGEVLRIRSRPGDELLPCAGLVQLSEEFLPYAGEEIDATTRLRLRVLAARTLREAPRPLVVVDDVQWLDQVSADVLSHAAGAVGRDRLAVVAAERTAGPPHRAAELLGGHPPVVPVRAAGHGEVADRLEALGLPARWSAAVLRYCGGMPDPLGDGSRPADRVGVGAGGDGGVQASVGGVEPQPRDAVPHRGAHGGRDPFRSLFGGYPVAHAVGGQTQVAAHRRAHVGGHLDSG